MVITPDVSRVRSAPEAAQVAGVTYRVLDYWARANWVVPSDVKQVGASRVVRRYTDEDVIRLALLRQITNAGLELRTWGPIIRELDLGDAELVLVTGDGDLVLADESDLRDIATSCGIRAGFDVAAWRSRLADDEVKEQVATSAAARRSA
jgi:DNA-binding transcriptional MerR regulator